MASSFSLDLPQQEPYVQKSFLIVMSTKNYDRALSKAQKVANTLVVPLNLRNIIKDPEGGLTSNEVCGCGEQHGYIPRGRADDGKYISIEYSTAYQGFTPGYYMVVVASGQRNELEDLLPTVQKHYKDAYIKNAEVYMGCMH